MWKERRGSLWFNDGDTDGVRCNVISCALAVQRSHLVRAMVLRGSAEKRVPHSPLTGLESNDKWAVSRIPGLYNMYRVLRGLYVGRSLSFVGGRRGSVDVVGKKTFVYHPLLGVFARLAMGVCAVEEVQAIVCLNDVYEGC